MGRILALLIRIACYLALAVVLAGIGCLVLVSELQLCPVLSEGPVSCITPFYESLARFGLGVVLVTVLGGFPGLMAIAGLIFLVRDIWRWRRATKAHPS